MTARSHTRLRRKAKRKRWPLEDRDRAPATEADVAYVRWSADERSMDRARRALAEESDR